MGGSTARCRPQHHQALGSWQKARFAITASVPHGAWGAPMRGPNPSTT